MERAIAALAATQHGVVTHAQLIGLGLSTAAIARRIDSGRLHVVHRGVYAVGHPALTNHGWWMAAVLAAGRDAVLSHRSAAALWGLLPARVKRVDVTVPSHRASREMILTHESELSGDTRTHREGIPVTTVPRTLLDLAAVESRQRLMAAFRMAEARHLVSPSVLLDMAGSCRGRRGVARLRQALADAGYGTGITRSELEARFSVFLRRHRLPAPARNVRMQLGALEVEADCVWVGAQVIVELDGRAFHDTGTAFERDRARDRALAVHGWTVLRVTWRQLERDELQLARDLRFLLHRAGG